MMPLSPRQDSNRKSIHRTFSLEISPNQSPRINLIRDTYEEKKDLVDDFPDSDNLSETSEEEEIFKPLSAEQIIQAKL